MPQQKHEVYYVRPGDSLWSIAQHYEVPVDTLARENHLPSAIIYINQPLLVPARQQRSHEAEAVSTRAYRSVTTYTVQAGDSLYTIANKYNTTVESLVLLNKLTNTNLEVGQTLTIPAYSEVEVTGKIANIRTGPGTTNDVLLQMVKNARLPLKGVQGNWYKVQLFNGKTGWIAKKVSTLNVYDGSQPISAIYGYYTLQEGPGLPSSYKSFVRHPAELSQLGLFLFRIKLENPTEIEKFGEFTDEEIATLVNTAHQNNVKILAVVHNLLYKRGDTTPSKDVVKALVSSPQNRQAFALNLVKLIEKYNLDGVDIDIEDVYEEDRDQLSLLYNEIAKTLNEKGYFFSAAIPSKVGADDPSEFAKPFDYKALGAALDQFVVMLYNEHGWPGSGPGPVVSIGRMEKVLRYAMTQMPKEKIIGAVSVFGFDFNLDTGKSSYVTYDMAVKRAEKYGSSIMFDEETQTPMYSYTDENGQKHEVWFENRESIKAKVKLADELGIKGVALWRLGMEDPAIWPMLRDEVVVTK